ncbi:MAG: putative quinol monooxygenase [Mesorhizobium sp.]
MIYVIATIELKPGSVDAVREAAAACRAETLKEDGCIAYEMFSSLSNADELVVVEQWASREALTAHSKQPHLKVWRDASAPHTLSRKIEIVHPEKVEQF